MYLVAFFKVLLQVHNVLMVEPTKNINLLENVLPEPQPPGLAAIMW